MSLHQDDNNKKSDDFYKNGRIDCLVVGNVCRFLDGRRTEGYIEDIFIDRGCFRWRITKYEDKGEFWDVDLEDVENYQFEKNSIVATIEQVKGYNTIIFKYNQQMVIEISEKQKRQSLSEIRRISDDIKLWLLEQVESKEKLIINFDNDCGNEVMTYFIQKYMKLIECEELELRTAKQLLLNPNSGEWFKGILIALAELGLTNYRGKVVRDDSTFKGIGLKELRKKYIIHRFAFVRAMFELNDKNDLVLYRGMSSESKWKNIRKSMIHMTFSKEVAGNFSDFTSSSKFQTSYLVKMTLPVEQIFITYIETDVLNERYKEKEALVVGEVDFHL